MRKHNEGVVMAFKLVDLSGRDSKKDEDKTEKSPTPVELQDEEMISARELLGIKKRKEKTGKEDS